MSEGVGAYTLTCVTCGVVLEHSSDRKKFCSRQCQGKAAILYRRKSPQWAEEEIEFLKLGYTAELPIDVIAAQLGRPLYGVYLKASRLQLTDIHRKKRPEHIEKMRVNLRAWWRTLDREAILHIVRHPVSEEARRQISVSLKRAYREGRKVVSESTRQRASDRMTQQRAQDSRFGHPGIGTAGKRTDLGFYVRSRWEANYARYLKRQVLVGEIREFVYEPERFEFADIKRGTRSYLPDFRVTHSDGRIEYHEVKGWWTDKARVAVARFRKRYPTLTLVIIGPEEYKQLGEEWAEQLDGWET